MLDIRVIRENVQWAKDKLATRGIDAAEIDEVVALDEKRRALIVRTEELKKNRNAASEAIAVAKRNKEDATEQIAAMKNVGAEIKELDAQLAEVKEKVDYILVRLPNFPNDSAPVGLDESFSREERKWSTPREFDFEPLAHWDIGEKLGILDFERAAKVSGSRFVYYKGAGARLERL